MNENNIGIIKLYEKKEISIMCGIIGFTGKLKAQDVLLTGLASLEYRGYDSAGIAYFKAQPQTEDNYPSYTPYPV